MLERRNFLQKISVLSFGALSINSLFNESLATPLQNATNLAAQTGNDEDYWKVIQDAYSCNSSDIIELNNGGVCPSPIVVQHALEKYNLTASQGPSYYMWQVMDKGREPLRKRLGELAGCDPAEIAINRNATEALNSIIYGLDFQKGDDIIGTEHDYPNMMNAWKQRASREGLNYKQLKFTFPIEDEDMVVEAYKKAITPKTKIIHVTHVINSVGQIMPVRKICDMAHAKGIEVIVDGAHSFAVLDFKIPDLHCDYLGTSLHKFLCAPVGSGMMWIKKEKISKIWPLLCNDNPRSDNIRKFESIGTRSFCIEQAIGEAINFHEAIGAKRKEDRLRFLKNYWAEKVITNPKVHLNTSLKPEYSCVIGSVRIDGVSTGDLVSKLFKSPYKIHTTGFDMGDIHGVRITPNVYTRLADLDKLVETINDIATAT